ALFKWLQSQLNMKAVLLKIDPLKETVSRLRQEGLELRDSISNEEEKISLTTKAVDKLVSEHSELSAEVDVTVLQLNDLKTRVDRADNVINNLQNEKSIWVSRLRELENQISELVGSCIIFVSHLFYSGYLPRTEIMEA